MFYAVRMQCGHWMNVSRPMQRERECRHCDPPTTRAVTHVLIDGSDRPGELIDIDRFCGLRQIAHAHDERVGKRERDQATRRIGRLQRASTITGNDRDLVDWALNARQRRLVDVAQHMWAKGYFPDAAHTEAVLARVALVDSERADALRAMLGTAENGIIPDKAWYAQFGARAISQEAHGRPTAR